MENIKYKISYFNDTTKNGYCIPVHDMEDYVMHLESLKEKSWIKDIRLIKETTVTEIIQYIDFEKPPTEDSFTPKSINKIKI